MVKSITSSSVLLWSHRLRSGPGIPRKHSILGFPGEAGADPSIKGKGWKHILCDDLVDTDQLLQEFWAGNINPGHSGAQSTWCVLMTCCGWTPNSVLGLILLQSQSFNEEKQWLGDFFFPFHLYYPSKTKALPFIWTKSCSLALGGSSYDEAKCRGSAKRSCWLGTFYCLHVYFFLLKKKNKHSVL